MMKSNQIIFIDDDVEDLALMEEMARTICFPKQVLAFHESEAALDYLRSSEITPFFILSDINMPRINGFELRTRMLAMNSNIKDAPFIFLSTSKEVEDIARSKHLNIKGYYQKTSSFAGMRKMLENIMSSIIPEPEA